MSHNDWTLTVKAVLKKRSGGIFCKSEGGKVAMPDHTLCNFINPTMQDSVTQTLLMKNWTDSLYGGRKGRWIR
jgi:hypothetical protein